MQRQSHVSVHAIRNIVLLIQVTVKVSIKVAWAIDLYHLLYNSSTRNWSSGVCALLCRDTSTRVYPTHLLLCISYTATSRRWVIHSVIIYSVPRLSLTPFYCILQWRRWVGPVAELYM